MKEVKIVFRFVLLFSFFIQLPCEASDSLSNVVVADLKDGWLIYNKQYNAFFPLINPDTKNIQSASQIIDCNKYDSYYLNFIASPGLSFFVENKLVYENHTREDQKIKIKINELPHSRANEKEVLSFFNVNGKLPLNSLFIGNNITNAPVKDQIYVARVIPRNMETTGNIYIITFLLIITGVAILKNRFPKKFYELFSFSNPIPDIDENVIWEISNFPVILFVLINALCASLILFVIKNEFDLDSLNFLNIFSHKPVLGILIVSGAFFMIYLLKYIQLKITGWIFNVKEIVKIQFFELMKVSLKINMFLTVLILIFYTSGYFNVKIDFEYFLYFTIISLLIVLFRVGYLTFTLSGFRNIYLFSYLCTTEILPLVIIVKLILY